MLLTISTTHKPATDLGFLLHKHPDRVHTFEQSFGSAQVFYPEATEDRCTAALLLEIDPVGLVRNRKASSEGHLLQQYVNDRPYVASSFLSVAIANAFGTAMNGRSKERQEVADTPIPLEVHIPCVACRGGEELLRRLFEPLGYQVEATRHELDAQFPEWGTSAYFSVQLKAICKLADLLTHLYVLIPVLDDDKHYWVGDDEVEKLLLRGRNWLPTHPDKELIARKYLSHKRSLTREALERLIDEDQKDPDAEDETHAEEEAKLEERISLNEQRLGSVLAVLRSANASRVIDMGCGEGRLVRTLMEHKEFTEIVGLDVSYRVLEMAQRRLRLEQAPERVRDRVKLIQGSLTYKDSRMSGFDAATCVEVIEHLDPPRLAAFERVIFEFAKPKMVVLTTPNSEYNCKFETLPAGKMRHRDHRFEWTRAEFREWCERVATDHGYTVNYLPIGENDPVVGPPTQMGVFTS